MPMCISEFDSLRLFIANVISDLGFDDPEDLDIF
jgi:hypothetical protein